MIRGLRVERVEASGTAYDQVVALGDANSVTLGHLPYAVFREAAESGCLLAASRDDEIIGYALFALRSRRHEVSLTHLCVRAESRGDGAARRLVEEIVRLHPDRRGIRLRCRVDYPAHNMWPQIGFQEWSQRPGRSHAGYPLAVWWRPIADLTLFDAHVQEGELPADEDRTIAALDTNVVRDLEQGRDEDASLALIADWVGDHAEFVITATVIHELQPAAGTAPTGIRDELRRLDPNEAAIDELYAAMHDAPGLGTHHEADLRIVAEAAAGGVAYLVSRDESLVRSADAIERITGVAVLRPADFLLSIQDDSGPGFVPKFIKTSDFSTQPSRSVPADKVLGRLTDQTRGERAASLRDRLADAVGRPEGRIEEVTASGTLWALAAHHVTGDTLCVSALRSLGDRRAYSLLRQLTHALRQRAVKMQTVHIEVIDEVSQSVSKALLDEGFSNTDGIWRAEVSRQVIGHGDPIPAELGLTQADGSPLSASVISRIESQRWPLKVFTGAVPCLIVPIQPSYGETLLGYQTAQLHLIETAPEAATARENAYYMTRRRGLQSPARLLWWVTGGGPEAGVRAMSWLDSVDVGTPERLHRKYSRRGVFELEQVHERATRVSGGPHVATVLLFSRTDVFTHAVDPVRARELDSKIWEQGFAVTARSVSERTAEALYREGMGSTYDANDA